MKKQISVRMKKTLLERIDRFAESRQITRTQAVEMLLQSVLSKQNEQEEKLNKRSRQGHDILYQKGGAAFLLQRESSSVDFYGVI